jgi:hypothetical protein
MKDFIGQEIKVGDVLFYGQTGRYAEFMTVKVLSMTDKTLLVQRLKGDRQGGMTHGSHLGEPFRIRDTNHCVNISLLPGVMC